MSDTSQASVTAFHGSPHDFDRFDAQRLGTGEGNQVYGQGLYFAGTEDVAKTYRDLAKSSSPVNQELSRLTSQLAPYRGERFGEYTDPRGYEIRRQIDSLVKQQADAPGYMYQVRINQDPNHFLDWDKTLGAQHPRVQQALGAGSFGTFDPTQTGGEFIAARTVGRSTSEVSAALHDAGIPGIRYLDGVSRSYGQGTHNYVVFSDADVSVTHKNGQPHIKEIAMSAPDREAIRQTSQDRWQTSLSGAVETQVTHGQSAAGYHFKIDTSDTDTEPRWSRAYATSEQARLAASSLGDSIRGDEMPDQTQREVARSQAGADVAQGLQVAQRQAQEIRPAASTP